VLKTPGRTFPASPAKKFGSGGKKIGTRNSHFLKASWLKKKNIFVCVIGKRIIFLILS
jgi:hypothetical protein